MDITFEKFRTQHWHRLLKTLFFHLLLAKKSCIFLPGTFDTFWLEGLLDASLFVILPLKTTRLLQQVTLTQCIRVLIFVPAANLLSHKNQHLKFLYQTLHSIVFLAKFVLRMDLW